MEVVTLVYQKTAIPLERLAVGSVLEIVTSVVVLGERYIFNAVYCLLFAILKQEHTAIRVFCVGVVVYLNIRLGYSSTSFCAILIASSIFSASKL